MNKLDKKIDSNFGNIENSINAKLDSIQNSINKTNASQFQESFSSGLMDSAFNPKAGVPNSPKTEIRVDSKGNEKKH